MPYTIVKSEKAPPKPVKKQSSKSAAYFTEIIKSLKNGDVAVISPEADQTQRGIKVSVGRVAAGLKIGIDSWSVDNDPNVYLALSPMKQATFA